MKKEQKQEMLDYLKTRKLSMWLFDNQDKISKDDLLHIALCLDFVLDNRSNPISKETLDELSAELNIAVTEE